MSPIPDGRADLILEKDLAARVIDLIHVNLPFQAATPIAAPLLFTFTFDKPLKLERLLFSMGTKQVPASGLAKAYLSRVNDPAVLDAATRRQGVVLFHAVTSGDPVNLSETFFPSVMYLDAEEPIYFFLTSDFAGVIDIHGVLTLYFLPTYR